MASETVEESILEDEAEAAEALKRLWDATVEQIKIGPKGLHTGIDFDYSHWEEKVNFYMGMFKKFSRLGIDVDALPFPLCWCRIYISVATVSAHTILANYSFENLYNEYLPLDVDRQIYNRFRGLTRLWIVEDVDTGQRQELRLPITGVNILPQGRSSSYYYSAPAEILTITTKAELLEDGTWEVGGCWYCLPGHTYRLQFIYGGLPSNVFTWTAPEQQNIILPELDRA